MPDLSTEKTKPTAIQPLVAEPSGELTPPPTTLPDVAKPTEQAHDIIKEQDGIILNGSVRPIQAVPGELPTISATARSQGLPNNTTVTSEGITNDLHTTGPWRRELEKRNAMRAKKAA